MRAHNARSGHPPQQRDSGRRGGPPPDIPWREIMTGPDSHLPALRLADEVADRYGGLPTWTRTPSVCAVGVPKNSSAVSKANRGRSAEVYPRSGLPPLSAISAKWSSSRSATSAAWPVVIARRCALRFASSTYCGNRACAHSVDGMTDDRVSSGALAATVVRAVWRAKGWDGANEATVALGEWLRPATGSDSEDRGRESDMMILTLVDLAASLAGLGDPLMVESLLTVFPTEHAVEAIIESKDDRVADEASRRIADEITRTYERDDDQ